MVAVSSLKYRYGSDKILSFPDFRVERGKACVLLGNSGSGKTTLLHLMGGLLKIQTGYIEIAKQDLSLLSESQADRFRGKHIGFVFQRNHLITALSVKKNLMLASFLGGTTQDEARLEELLAQLGLWEKKNAKVHELSQGQAQRVAIARSMVNKPAVIFADEPTSALDDYHCDRSINLLLSLSEQNHTTLVVATHDQRLRSIITHQVQINNS